YALEALQENLTPDDRGMWAQSLVNLLIATWRDVRVMELAISLDVLHDNRYLLDPRDNGRVDWLVLMRLLSEAVRHTLTHSSNSGARSRLVHALWRLHEDLGYEALRVNVGSFLEFQFPAETSDYRLALEYIEMAKKLPGPRIEPKDLPSVQK